LKDEEEKEKGSYLNGSFSSQYYSGNTSHQSRLDFFLGYLYLLKDAHIQNKHYFHSLVNKELRLKFVYMNKSTESFFFS